jgi:hypothetical protein
VSGLGHGLVLVLVVGLGTLLAAQGCFPTSRVGRVIVWLLGVWLAFLVLKAAVT